MSRQPSDTEILGEALAHGAGEAGDDHLTLDQLSAFLSETLESSAEAKVNDHLVACSACCQELLELQAFEGDDAPAEGVDSEFRMGSAWRAVRKEIRQNEARRRKAPGRRWFLAVAAGLPFLVLSAGFLHLGTANLALRNMNEDLRRAALEGFSSDDDPFVIALPPLGRGAETIKVVPEWARAVMIRIPNLRSKGYSSFTVELSRIDGESYRRQQLEISDSGFLEVAYPRFALREGEYKIRCFGVVGESQEEEEIPYSDLRFRVGSWSLDATQPAVLVE